jgi:hypothetical protein
LLATEYGFLNFQPRDSSSYAAIPPRKRVDHCKISFITSKARKQDDLMVVLITDPFEIMLRRKRVPSKISAQKNQKPFKDLPLLFMLVTTGIE